MSCLFVYADFGGDGSHGDTAIALLPRKRPTRVIIDTDVGDDIDDALAILVAAAMHRVGAIKIVAAITSGHGQHYTRAKLVRRLIRAVLGTCDVAIIMGRERLGTTKGNYMICGRYVFAGKFPRLGDSEKRWLLRTIRSEYRRGKPSNFYALAHCTTCATSPRLGARLSSLSWAVVSSDFSMARTHHRVSQSTT